jgi:PAS domain S-box-containing protein
MIVIYFLNGLGFFTLGLSIAFEAGKSSAFKITYTLWLIAAFGVLYGLSEWIDMFLLIEHSPAVIGILKTILLVTLPVSFYCLMRFGILNIVQAEKRFAGLKKIPIILPAVWGFVTALSNVPLLAGPIFAQYVLGLPAALLTSYALLLQIREPVPVHKPATKRLLKTSAGAFFFYAIFAGLVVPFAGFFPASVINYSLFTKVLGTPVQVFRTACALTVMYSMVSLLRIFERETKTALRESMDSLQKAYGEAEKNVRERTAELTIASSRFQHEVREHKRSEKELKFFQYFMDQSNDAIFVIEAETGRVLNLNERACTSLQYPCEELIVMHFFDYAVNVPDFTSWQRLAQKIQNLGYLYFETDLKRKDGTRLPAEISARYVIHDEKGYIVAIARDVTERKRVDAALQKWSDIFNHTKIGVVIVGPEAKTLDMMNEAFAVMHGYTVEELAGRPVGDIIGPEGRAELQRQLSTINQKGDHVFDAISKRKDGTTFPVQVDVAAVKDGDGNVLYCITNMLDISERKQVEEILRFAARQWRTTFDAMKDMVFLLDREGRIKRCNIATAVYFDKPLEEINGRNCCEFIHGTKVPAEQCPFQLMLQTKRREHNILQRGEKWFDVVVDPLLDDSGAVNGAVHIMYDVTERKQAEEQIRESLGEKEILLKEIHHRVKNNLQVIMSLLRHQAEYAQDQKIHDIFLESQSRIKAMSFIHEKLYQSDNLAKICLRDYIGSLAKSLFSTYKVNAAQIHLAVDADDISLGVDTAIPCGLIINELVSNSLKHAFPDSRTGRIAITVRTVRPGEFELVVDDDGVGIPPGLDIINAKSLGLHLVTLLAKNQLRGNIEIMKNTGTRFRIRFKGAEA